MLEKQINLNLTIHTLLILDGLCLNLKDTRSQKYLQLALQLMPADPIVNDHYGDVLWKMEMKFKQDIIGIMF